MLVGTALDRAQLGVDLVRIRASELLRENPLCMVGGEPRRHRLRYRNAYIDGKPIAAEVDEVPAAKGFGASRDDEDLIDASPVRRALVDENVAGVLLTNDRMTSADCGVG